jgi:hypothetical protein
MYGEAKSDCATRSNGWLVSITSGIMNTVVSNKRLDSGSKYWLGSSCGSNCAPGGGTWVWESGEPWLYSNWASGEPSNTKYYNWFILIGSEACLQMLGGGNNWNDGVCWDSFPYVCQVFSQTNTPTRVPTRIPYISTTCITYINI